MFENKDRGCGGYLILFGLIIFYLCRIEIFFFYFVLFLVLLKLEKVNIVFMGSDREVVVWNGFSLFFFLVIWLFCFKYVEDDIKRKLNSFVIKDFF